MKTLTTITHYVEIGDEVLYEGQIWTLEKVLHSPFNDNGGNIYIRSHLVLRKLISTSRDYSIAAPIGHCSLPGVTGGAIVWPR